MDTQLPLDKGLEKDLTKLDDKKYENLEDQVQEEYKLSWDHQYPKKTEWQTRLKLYNNQKRDKKAIGDTTLFTTHQTILASLYVDKLVTDWIGKEEGDDEVADNLNALSSNDYDDMEKDITDYDWDWDTLFFGRGLLGLSEYIREPENNIYLPIPEVLDPITFLRDPRAISVNGNRLGKGAARFFGYESKITRQQMEDNKNMFNLDFRSIKIGSGTQSLLEDAIQARSDAQGTQYRKNAESEKRLRENAEYDITVWHTHWKVGGKVKKVKAWLANNRKLLIGVQVLDFDKWQVIDRPLYPTSHDWDGTSIPDITEDKQRARAIATNLGLDAMKADLYPMYIFDTNRIKNRNDLNFNFNKFIPSDGPTNGAIEPMRKSFPNLALMEFIYNSLDVSAQKATATPEIQQGMMSQEKRTLGEVNIIASKVDTRYSLSAKIFGWSEKRFWLQWYQMYKKYFKEDIDEKVVRIVGAFGAKWRPLTKDQIIANIDPDVKIESQVVSRAKQLEERQNLTSFFSLAFQDPNSNRGYGLRKLAKLNGMTKDEVERLFPPTVDEREAEAENDMINKNKTPEVTREQDHNVHLEVHNKATDTKAKFAHVETHQKALMIRRSNPELFPQDMNQTAMNPPGSPDMLARPTPMPTPGVTPSQTSNQL
ncbi:MAG: hypothetical protein NUV73_04445 [Candidatus Daviesbacteria bacterium]|nr:hypothetical protein [Candidatus Daviesbacteria bacterium]